MESPISSIVTHLSMEVCTKAINIATYLPNFWFRSLHYTFVPANAEHNIQFLQNTNSIDPQIQFTKEPSYTDGTISFLDTIVSPGPDNTCLPQSTENLPTQTSTFSGTATITYLLSKVSFILSHIGLGQSTAKQRRGCHRGCLPRCKYPPWALSILKPKSNDKYRNTQA